MRLFQLTRHIIDRVNAFCLHHVLVSMRPLPSVRLNELISSVIPVIQLHFCLIRSAHRGLSAPRMRVCKNSHLHAAHIYSIQNREGWFSETPKTCLSPCRYFLSVHRAKSHNMTKRKNNLIRLFCCIGGDEMLVQKQSSNHYHLLCNNTHTCKHANTHTHTQLL